MGTILHAMLVIAGLTWGFFFGLFFERYVIPKIRSKKSVVYTINTEEKYEEPYIPMSKYTFYWNDGTCQVLEGATPMNALRLANCLPEQGNKRSLVYWEFGVDHKYEWISSLNIWVPKGMKPCLS